MKTSVWVIVKCKSTGRFMLGLRGKKMNNPNLWNFFGGSVNAGEALNIAASRELKEEVGLIGNLHSIGSVINKGQHMYFYLLTILTEIIPNLDHETEIHRWMGPNRMLKLSNARKLHGPTDIFFRSNLMTTI